MSWGGTCSKKQYAKNLKDFKKATEYVVKTYPECAVFCPPSNEIYFGSKPDLDWGQYMMIYDIPWLACSDKIFMVKGWEKSLGATVELALAKHWGLEVIYQ